MANFVFSGDPSHPGTDPAEGNLLGLEYRLNVPFEVKDESIAGKLRNHSHFTELAAGEQWDPKARKAKASAPKPAAVFDVKPKTPDSPPKAG